MYRFFCPSSNISVDRIIIGDKEQVHHIKDVLRFKAEDKVVIFDDKGNEYNCVIKKLSSEVILNIKDRRSSYQKREKVAITVACAIPKKSKMDDIVDKLTQLGVDRIIPLETERVIIRLDKDKKVARQKRWERIALSAAVQSQRNSLPIIEPIKNIKEVLTDLSSYDLKLMPTLSGERRTLKDIFPETKAKSILILIGPEGDFTPEEVNLAKKFGCTPVSLGDLVLRVETAVVAVTSFIRLYENS